MSVSYITFIYFRGTTAASEPVPSVETSRSHSHTHHTPQGFSGLVTQKPLPVNTQHSQERDIHAPDWIRTRNPSKRVAADHRVNLRGHWGRHLNKQPCLMVLGIFVYFNKLDLITV